MNKAEKLIESLIVEASEYYFVHVEPATVGSDLRYHNISSSHPAIKKVLRSIPQPKEVLAVGYDDVTFAYTKLSVAVAVAKKLDKILGPASSSHKRDYGVRNNATVSGPYDSDMQDTELTRYEIYGTR